MLMRRGDVASISIRRHFDVICPLGALLIVLLSLGLTSLRRYFGVMCPLGALLVVLLSFGFNNINLGKGIHIVYTYMSTYSVSFYPNHHDSSPCGRIRGYCATSGCRWGLTVAFLLHTTCHLQPLELFINFLLCIC